MRQCAATLRAVFDEFGGREVALRACFRALRKLRTRWIHVVGSRHVENDACDW